MKFGLICLIFLLCIGWATSQNPGCKLYNEVPIDGGTLTNFKCPARKFPGTFFESVVFKTKSKVSLGACVQYCSSNYYNGCRSFCYNSKSKRCSLSHYNYVTPVNGPMVSRPAYITCGYNDDHEE